MDKLALRQLLAAGSWTVGELEQRNPALAAQVAALVDESRRTRIAAVVSALPEETRARVANVELSRIAGDTLTTLRSRLHAAGVDATSADAVAERVSALDDVGADRRLSSDPVIGQQLALARVYAISEIAGLDDARAAEVAVQAPAATALNDSMLTRLVAGGALSEQEARTVGLAATLLPLVDDNIPLATAIRTEAFTALDGVPATNVSALAALTVADWERFLTANTRVLPSGVTAGQLAGVLAGRFAVMSRARAFASRFPRSEAPEITARLIALQDVYARNPRVVGVPIDALDISAIEPDRRSAITARHAELATLAAAYPGLEIAAVLDDTTSEPTNRAETAARRIGLLHQLLARLGEESVLEIDLRSHGNRLLPLLRDGLSATEPEAAMVVATLRAYQRTWAIAQDIDRTHALVARGFSSALSIGSLGVARFTARSGLAAEPSRLVWERARGAMADVALTAGAVLDVAQGQHGGLAITNPSSSVTGELTRLAGFEELFGNLAFCACTECQSILGPAAYFVDLMKYIDDHLRVAFAGHPGHPLDLRTRRPDLWELPLTCDNTNHRVATLELVAEILENYIAHRLGYSGPLTDRGAIGSVVYGQALANTVDSVVQPFELPLARVGAYLEALGSSRTAVASAVGATATAVTRAALGVGERVRVLIATADLDLPHLAHVYGIAFTGTAAAVDNVDASVIAAALGITRRELGQLVAMDLIGAGVSIVPAKRDATSVQNDVEWLTGLSATVLDRMLRIRRLLRALHWSAADLDLACATLGITELSTIALEDLGQLVELQIRLGVDLAEICAICGSDGGVDGLVTRRTLLAQKLGLVSDDLARLMALTNLPALAGVRDVAAAVDTSAWWQSAAYSLDDIAVATGQPPHAPARYPDPAVVATQVATKAGTSLTFVDTVFSVALGISEQGSKDLIAQNTTLFEPVPGGWHLTPGDLESAAIMVPPSALVPTAPVGTRLATVEEVRSALRPHRPFDAVARALGFAFGLPTEKVAALAALAGLVPLPATVLAAVRADGAIAPLVSYIDALRPLVIAFADSAWDATAVEFARTHPDRFGPSLLPGLDPAQLRGLRSYSDLAARAKAPDLQTALSAFDGTSFPASADELLARVFGVPSATVAGLRERMNLPTRAIEALVQIDRAAQLARTLGIDGETLVAIAGDSYSELSSAADKLAVALAVRSADAARGAAAVDKAEQPVREAKRDALASYLIHSISPAMWRSLDELYEYFLIDVAAGGCSSTSRVVAATTSAQLYVHRALMNLEDDGRPVADPEHVALRMPADAAAEWSWRKTYRVWQANRSLFLWPENYLEPDLRDDKTPLFRELEQELLQTDITDQNVLDAYTKYLAGFEEVASLTLAGAYHQVGTSSDVLHLFGVSASDPPAYYYRTCENLRASRRDPSAAAVWSPWQKLTVQVTGRKVSPIVHRGRLHVFWTDVRTKPVSRVVSGSSEFAGYTHTMSLRFTTLRPDGAWTAPQVVQLGSAYPFGPSRGQIRDPITTTDGPGPAALDPQRRVQSDSIDDYTLAGSNWDWCWLQSQPSGLRIQFRDFLERADLDLFKRTTVPASWPAPTTPNPQLLFARHGSPWRALYAGTPWWMFWPAPAYANALIDEQRLDVLEQDFPGYKHGFLPEQFSTHVASIPMGSELLAVPGSESDALIQVGDDLLHLDGGERDDGGYVVRRLGTTLVESIARRLFEDGLDSVLDTQTQLALAEARIPIVLVWDKVLDRSNAGTLDLAGPYGAYYRELYLHIPYLIANALHSRGRFAAAQRWYHYIFDPTSTEVIDASSVAPAEVAHRLLDRVWRCRELRGLDLAHVRDMLSDPSALALYRRDPFNPWAIARRRPSAIQQAIVMKYLANILDWGDSLFAQFTMESVNEALMLYVTAEEILGRRPVALGDCGAVIGTGDALSYAAVAPLIASSGELLVELETWLIGARASHAPPRGATTTTFGAQPTALVHAVTAMARPAPTNAAGTAGPHFDALDGLPMLDFVKAEDGGVFRGLGWRDTRTASWGPALGNATVRTPDTMGGRTFEHAWKKDFAASAGTFGFSLLQLAPVFCVPGNAALFGLWDRVEDRLYKIRHCQGLDGQLRELALFAPALDPADLASLEAGGFGLEDVLAAGNGNLPPYRFAYLIERAKAFAGLLSGLGGALLAAYEKKDGEHLSRVRMTQQMNLAQMTTQALRLDIQVAAATLEGVDEQLAAAEYRRDYYAGLVANGRNTWEMVETAARHTSSGIRVVEGSLGALAAGLSLLPELGSPFAMKYGGIAIGTSMERFSGVSSTLAAIADGVASSASFEGSFARRTDGWRHQKGLADFDMKSLQRQREAARVRLEIANRSLASHERALDQLALISELTDERFTNLGLYTWLSAQMQRHYRAAYQNALALAKLAERAFRFERGEDTAAGLASTYWDTGRAGLLAGDGLLVDLQTLERRFLETNYRSLEVDQAFALSQLDAAALLELRETGTCVFTASEAFFDLFYPGHFKRRIKAVRLTIPCITGPYVNVGATLEIDRSWLRVVPTPGAPLVEVPPTRSVSVATSTAQNDAGVFELSFRDERYMPFEGLGAISRWRLSLPKAFRQFDYQTINDVILSISYTAEHDASLRERVESDNAALEGSITQFYTAHPARRVFSLRQDFASAFTRLIRSPANTEVKFEITDRSLPLVFAGRAVRITRAMLLLRTAPGSQPTGVRIVIDGQVAGSLAPEPTLSNLPAVDISTAFANLRGTHTLAIEQPGALALASPPPGEIAAIDDTRLRDVLLYIEYVLA